jgi:flagellar hook-length control protein FliK
VPLDAPDFSQKLADQVSLWVGQVKQDGPMTAELHLNPAEMGPINVKISLDGTAAHVDFAAAAQETRQAIEASLSTLSSALNDVGLSLTGGGVSSQTPQQTFAQGGNPSQDGRGARGANGRAGDDDVEAADASGLHQVSAPRSSRLGGLDLYA